MSISWTLCGFVSFYRFSYDVACVALCCHIDIMTGNVCISIDMWYYTTFMPSCYNDSQCIISVDLWYYNTFTMCLPVFIDSVLADSLIERIEEQVLRMVLVMFALWVDLYSCCDFRNRWVPALGVVSKHLEPNIPDEHMGNIMSSRFLNIEWNSLAHESSSKFTEANKTRLWAVTSSVLSVCNFLSFPTANSKSHILETPWGPTRWPHTLSAG